MTGPVWLPPEPMQSASSACTVRAPVCAVVMHGRLNPTVTSEGAAVAPGVWLASPLYVAVIAWAPGWNAPVRSCARPSSSGTVASGVAPSKKVTVPPGAPAAGFAEAAVAVRVTACPNSGVAVSAATSSEAPYRKVTTAFPLPRLTPWARVTPVAEGAA